MDVRFIQINILYFAIFRLLAISVVDWFLRTIFKIIAFCSSTVLYFLSSGMTVLNKLLSLGRQGVLVIFALLGGERLYRSYLPISCR